MKRKKDQRDTERERDAHIHTHRDGERETERETHTYIHTHRDGKVKAGNKVNEQTGRFFCIVKTNELYKFL